MSAFSKSDTWAKAARSCPEAVSLPGSALIVAAGGSA
jgi:hypothetical protein